MVRRCFLNIKEENLEKHSFLSAAHWFPSFSEEGRRDNVLNCAEHPLGRGASGRYAETFPGDYRKSWILTVVFSPQICLCFHGRLQSSQGAVRTPPFLTFIAFFEAERVPGQSEFPYFWEPGQQALPLALVHCNPSCLRCQSFRLFPAFMLEAKQHFLMLLPTCQRIHGSKPCGTLLCCQLLSEKLEIFFSLHLMSR